ncbi:hypothetical protein GCM10011502_08800 [Oceanisphaera marina]|uniref:Uncharacterized protein n=1 Tax=Oceanisphaera marina TaxID=2017550 RepID=A0ABQ1IER1_9GAMM|nr:hypothetical protein [Oceanisphaera marina]GGB37816.1 hypothetical protein GCM10011502_08800 [Oceanisphaera marina]
MISKTTIIYAGFYFLLCEQKSGIEKHQKELGQALQAQGCAGAAGTGGTE